MRSWINMLLSAIATMCLVAPVSATLAQDGITANPAPLKTQQYLGAVLELSRYEVASSRLALARSQNESSRSFAQQMIDHHTRTLAVYGPLLGSPKASESLGALNEPLSQMLETLESTPRANFDGAFRQGQIAAHEEALKVHSAYAANGADTAMRARAGKIVTMIRKHLDEARRLPSR